MHRACVSERHIPSSELLSYTYLCITSLGKGKEVFDLKYVRTQVDNLVKASLGTTIMPYRSIS